MPAEYMHLTFASAY